MSDNEQRYLVIGVFTGGYDEPERFAETFTTTSPQGAETAAEDWAEMVAPDVTCVIAGVLDGEGKVVG